MEARLIVDFMLHFRLYTNAVLQMYVLDLRIRRLFWGWYELKKKEVMSYVYA